MKTFKEFVAEADFKVGQSIMQKSNAARGKITKVLKDGDVEVKWVETKSNSTVKAAGIVKL